MDSKDQEHKEEKKENVELKEENKVSSSNENESHKKENEVKNQDKKNIKLPVFAVIIGVVVIIAVILTLFFVFHVGKTAQITSFTPINSFSPSFLSNIFGGNWTTVANKSANSTVIKQDASQFPPGTLGAAIEQFIPSSELSLIAANNTANVTEFSSEVFYLNSSNSVSPLLSQMNSSVDTLLASNQNNTKIESNYSVIGSSKMIYINIIENYNTSNKTRSSELYIGNGKDFVIDSINNGNITYNQAKSLATYPFSKQ